MNIVFMSRFVFQPGIVQVLARILCAVRKNGGVLSRSLPNSCGVRGLAGSRPSRICGKGARPESPLSGGANSCETQIFPACQKNQRSRGSSTLPISHTQRRLCSRRPPIIGLNRLKSALIGVNQGTEYCFMSLSFQPAIAQVLARILCAAHKSGSVLGQALCHCKNSANEILLRL
jgi:hypothetical protein